MRKEPEANEIYRHFKGNSYQVICIALDSESGAKMVVYQAMYAPYKIFVRSLEMFMSETDHIKYPEARCAYRFTLIGRAGNINLENETECIKFQPVQSGESAIDNAVQLSPGGASSSVNTVQSVTGQKAQPIPTGTAQDEEMMDPQVEAFLDARRMEDKLRILESMHERINNEMINTMAVASDLEIKDGDIETRFEDLRYCLMTLGKFECDRLR